MNKKIISIFVVLTIICLIMPVFSNAANTVTLEKAEDNVCTIALGTDGKLTKKLLSVDDTNKEVTLQVDVTNLKTTDTETKESEVMLVVDNSASMQKNTLADGTTRKDAVFNAAKSLAKSILTAQSKSKVGVVSFSTNTDDTKVATLEDAKLETALTSDETAVETAISNITTQGDQTDIDAGLQIAKANFGTDTSINKYIILLTDGVPNISVGGAKSAVYSSTTATNTKATLKSVIDSGINVVTVMTGVSSANIPDPNGATSSEAKGKTYQELAEEVFGTEENPNYGKFYYVKDEDVVKTITDTVYTNITTTVDNSIKNITVKDYFPDDIIANYDFSIVEQANIGSVTANVDTTDNSITWTIEKLDANKTASFKYKLKLKDNYNSSILNVIMPTNKKVDVTYTGTDNTTKTETSDVSPKIVLKGDTTQATTTIPQTGNYNYIYVLATLLILTIIIVSIYNYRKIK